MAAMQQAHEEYEEMDQFYAVRKQKDDQQRWINEWVSATLPSPPKMVWRSYDSCQNTYHRDTKGKHVHTDRRGGMIFEPIVPGERFVRCNQSLRGEWVPEDQQFMEDENLVDAFQLDSISLHDQMTAGPSSRIMIQEKEEIKIGKGMESEDSLSLDEGTIVQNAQHRSSENVQITSTINEGNPRLSGASQAWLGHLPGYHELNFRKLMTNHEQYTTWVRGINKIVDTIPEGISKPGLLEYFAENIPKEELLTMSNSARNDYQKALRKFELDKYMKRTPKDRRNAMIAIKKYLIQQNAEIPIQKELRKHICIICGQYLTTPISAFACIPHNCDKNCLLVKKTNEIVIFYGNNFMCPGDRDCAAFRQKEERRDAHPILFRKELWNAKVDQNRVNTILNLTFQLGKKQVEDYKTRKTQNVGELLQKVNFHESCLDMIDKFNKFPELRPIRPGNVKELPLSCYSPYAAMYDKFMRISADYDVDIVKCIHDIVFVIGSYTSCKNFCGKPIAKIMDIVPDLDV
jgi:hypothetical protein